MPSQNSSSPEKLDYESMIFRQVDRVGYILANTMDTNDYTSGGNTVFQTVAPTYALFNSIVALEAMLIPRLQGITEYWQRKKPIADNIENFLYSKENDHLPFYNYGLEQRIFIGETMKLFSLLLSYFPKMKLIKGKAETTTSGGGAEDDS